MDEVDSLVGAGKEVVGDEAGERQDLRERRPVAESVERGGDRDSRAAHRRGALASDGHDGQVAGGASDLAGRVADRIRVERAREAAVGREQDDEPTAAFTDVGQQRMVLGVQHRGGVREDLVELLAVRPRLERRVLGALELGGRHELHRARDLLDVADRSDASPDLALTGHEGLRVLLVGEAVRPRRSP